MVTAAEHSREDLVRHVTLRSTYITWARDVGIVQLDVSREFLAATDFTAGQWLICRPGGSAIRYSGETREPCCWPVPQRRAIYLVS